MIQNNIISIVAVKPGLVYGPFRRGNDIRAFFHRQVNAAVQLLFSRCRIDSCAKGIGNPRIGRTGIGILNFHIVMNSVVRKRRGKNIRPILTQFRSAALRRRRFFCQFQKLVKRIRSAQSLLIHIVRIHRCLSKLKRSFTECSACHRDA